MSTSPQDDMKTRGVDRRRKVGPAVVVRWLARASSIATVALLLMFATSGGAAPSWSQWVAISLFPVGVVAGLILAWRHELVGGLFALVSLGLFYVWMGLVAGEVDLGPWFTVFTSPALLFVLSAVLARRRGQ